MWGKWDVVKLACQEAEKDCCMHSWEHSSSSACHLGFSGAGWPGQTQLKSLVGCYGQHRLCLLGCSLIPSLRSPKSSCWSKQNSPCCWGTVTWDNLNHYFKWVETDSPSSGSRGRPAGPTGLPDTKLVWFAAWNHNLWIKVTSSIGGKAFSGFLDSGLVGFGGYQAAGLDLCREGGRLLNLIVRKNGWICAGLCSVHAWPLPTFLAFPFASGMGCHCGCIVGGSAAEGQRICLSHADRPWQLSWCQQGQKLDVSPEESLGMLWMPILQVPTSPATYRSSPHQLLPLKATQMRL